MVNRDGCDDHRNDETCECAAIDRLVTAADMRAANVRRARQYLADHTWGEYTENAESHLAIMFEDIRAETLEAAATLVGATLQRAWNDGWEDARPAIESLPHAIRALKA